MHSQMTDVIPRRHRFLWMLRCSMDMTPFKRRVRTITRDVRRGYSAT